MSKITHAQGEYVANAYADERPLGSLVRWCHFDVISAMRAQEAIEATAADDFRLKAYHLRRELLLAQIRNILRDQLPEERDSLPEGGR